MPNATLFSATHSRVRQDTNTASSPSTGGNRDAASPSSLSGSNRPDSESSGDTDLTNPSVVRNLLNLLKEMRDDQKNMKVSRKIITVLALIVTCLFKYVMHFHTYVHNWLMKKRGA